MRTALVTLLALIVVAPTALFLPGPVTLELYDVQDIVYTMPDWPSVDISLAGSGTDGMTVGMTVDYHLLTDLADDVRTLVPGSRNRAGGRSVNCQNGLLIVRATPVQHVAVRLALALTRSRIRLLEGVNACLSKISLRR